MDSPTERRHRWALDDWDIYFLQDELNRREGVERASSQLLFYATIVVVLLLMVLL